MKWMLNQFAASWALGQTAWPAGRRRLVVTLAILLGAGLLTALYVYRQTRVELAATRAALAKQAFVPFEKQVLRAVNADGIELLQSSKNVRSLARFNESYFAATDGGLMEFSTAGKTTRRYSVLDGLPESDLTCLAVFNARLFIGTRAQGLVAFDGAGFERYRWPDRQALAVTALLVEQGRLLIGTFAGGLLEFDGRQFKEIKAGAEQQRLTAINYLAAEGARLYVGTFAAGLWINEAGRWRQFTMADGLPSNRIVGVVVGGELLFVATDFGVATAKLPELFHAAGAANAQRFQAAVTVPATASIARYGNAILLGKDNGEVFQLVTDARAPRIQLQPRNWPRPENLSSCQLTTFEQSLWLLSSEGVWRTGWQDKGFSGRLNFAAYGHDEAARAEDPTSSLISALAFDDAGRLWVGSFRNGLDVFAREGVKLAHLESETVREINALVWDEATKRMLAATAQGLLSFDAALQAQRVSKTDGLLSNAIAHAATLPIKNSTASRAEIVLATSRGLALGQAHQRSGQWRGLTTAQGLPSNNVYAVLPHREAIYAGTLNGLAQIAGGRVVRVFKDANSRLNQNWVAALCAAGGRVFVGTYGGGVFELTAAGEFVSFAAEIGRQTVNPNAMFSDGERVYVGTLDGAWALDLRTQKWAHLRAELPAPAVLSIAGDGERIYLGTTSGIVRVHKNRWQFVGE